MERSKEEEGDQNLTTDRCDDYWESMMADEEVNDGEEEVNEWSCPYFFPHRWKKPIRRHLQNIT